MFLLALACVDPSPPEPYEIWVADQLGSSVLAFDERGALLGTVTDGFSVSALAWADDTLLAADFAEHTVLEIDPASGEPQTLYQNGPDPDALRIEEPCGLLLDDSSDSLLVLANDTANVGILARDGSVEGEVGPEDPLRSAHGFALLDDGRLAVASSPVAANLGLVRIWDLETRVVIAQFAPWGEIEEGTDVTALPDGSLAVTDFFGGQIVRYDPDTGLPLESIARELEDPVAAAVAPDGALVVVTRNTLLRIDEDGVTTLAFGLSFGRDVIIVPSQTR